MSINFIVPRPFEPNVPIITQYPTRDAKTPRETQRSPSTSPLRYRQGRQIDTSSACLNSDLGGPWPAVGAQAFKVLQVPKTQSRISNAKFPMAFPFSAAGVAPRIVRLSLCLLVQFSMTRRWDDGMTGSR